MVYFIALIYFVFGLVLYIKGVNTKTFDPGILMYLFMVIVGPITFVVWSFMCGWEDLFNND